MPRSALVVKQKGKRQVDYRPQWWHFYTTPEWIKNIRPNVLERDKHTCQQCGRPGKVVDHIVPHRGSKRLQMDIDNCQCLCLACHAAKSASERIGGKRG